MRSTQLSIHRDRILVLRAREDLVARDFEIPPEPAANETSRSELVRDARVEADASEIEEEPSLDLAGIDHAFVTTERNLECRV